MAENISVSEFESLKKRRDQIVLEKAREEAKRETLEKEIETYLESLKEYNINNENDARLLLDQMTGELAVEMHKLEEAIRSYDNNTEVV